MLWEDAPVQNQMKKKIHEEYTSNEDSSAAAIES